MEARLEVENLPMFLNQGFSFKLWWYYYNREFATASVRFVGYFLQKKTKIINQKLPDTIFTIHQKNSYENVKHRAREIVLIGSNAK